MQSIHSVKKPLLYRMIKWVDTHPNLSFIIATVAATAFSVLTIYTIPINQTNTF